MVVLDVTQEISNKLSEPKQADYTEDKQNIFTFLKHSFLILEVKSQQTPCHGLKNFITITLLPTFH